MAKKATEAEVSAFLRRFKEAVKENGLSIWPTAKNQKFLTDSGFTNDDVVEALKSLVPRNYAAGPEEDDNPARPAGEVWKFAREYEGYEMYIKLKLDPQTNLPVAECLSFHEAERDMRQPGWTRR